MAIRRIEKSDNAAAAKIVRDVMTEFGAVGKGYSIEDPEVDFFFEHYSQERYAFFVIEENGQVLGCAGIAPLKGSTGAICELQKMYFRSALRGKGWGQKMLDACLKEARRLGYQNMYLETLQSMSRANALYTKNGFVPLPVAQGCTGHGACDAYYSLEL